MRILNYAVPAYLCRHVWSTLAESILAAGFGGPLELDSNIIQMQCARCQSDPVFPYIANIRPTCSAPRRECVFSPCLGNGRHEGAPDRSRQIGIPGAGTHQHLVRLQGVIYHHDVYPLICSEKYRESAEQ